MEDKRDPVCGMKGTIPAHGQYFCSEQCIKKYEQQHGIPEEEQYCPSCTVQEGTPWYKQKLFIILLLTTIALIISYINPFPTVNLFPFFDAFKEYLALIWWALLIGFLLGGVIDYFIPNKYIEKYLSRHRKRTIFYSVIFGFLMSACSHGILAIAIELYKKGASTSSVIAFLLASPWANLPITILLFGFFGYHAPIIIISAIIIAIITGFIYQQLEKHNLVECDKCRLGEDTPLHTDFSIINDLKQRWKNTTFSWKTIKNALIGVFQGSWSLTKMVLWWILIGMTMASIARGFIPQNLFMTYMGPTALGLLVTLLFATVIEVCSEGSAPLAFEIFNQTGALGNSTVFLMAGVATDYTEIGLIWSNIGKKAALWLPIITVPQVLILGYLLNWVIP